MATAAGSRGGTTASLLEAQDLFAQWKREEYGWLRARILWLAMQKGEFHADQLEGLTLSQRNVIGAAIRGLLNSGLIVSTGEHRVGRGEASHGRRSYVYRATDRGHSVVRAMGQTPRSKLPQRPPTTPSATDPQSAEQPALFDPGPAPPQRQIGAHRASYEDPDF